ncbi:histone-lysine N-methyltransferase SETMAR-like [Stegodyphus dumicola]|uniref:histone-lysine N-methyltransferase SETMAR-like n=1 Tax=Stegodyphus dumicola TaxID=202533 RepID=UPI0015A93AFE|nr:histone-lysine N-methyltransferase SETMAR-like [Stegodyphus dumicola]
MGKSTVQAQQRLEKCYPDSAPSKTTICRWYVYLKRSRMDTNDAGRPNEAVTPENVKQVLKIVMNDRNREIAETVNISTGSACAILHEKLGIKKVFSKWVPRLLTMELKQQRVDDSQSCLPLFTHNEQDFLRRYVTLDEMQIHYFTPELKQQSAEWRAASESRPNCPKMLQSAGKVMASVFWDARGIIYIGYLEKGKFINSTYYTEILALLKQKIAKKRPHTKKKKNHLPSRQCKHWLH